MTKTLKVQLLNRQSPSLIKVNGTAKLNADGTVTFTHDGSETTTGSFKYTIEDADGATSNKATVTITRYASK